MRFSAKQHLFYSAYVKGYKLQFLCYKKMFLTIFKLMMISEKSLL